MHTSHNKQFEKDENNLVAWRLPDRRDVGIVTDTSDTIYPTRFL